MSAFMVTEQYCPELPDGNRSGYFLSISSDQMILIAIPTEYANVDHLAWVVWWPPIQKFWGERQFYKEMFGLYKQRLQILELMTSINILPSLLQLSLVDGCCREYQ